MNSMIVSDEMYCNLLDICGKIDVMYKYNIMSMPTNSVCTILIYVISCLVTEIAAL